MDEWLEINEFNNLIVYMYTNQYELLHDMKTLHYIYLNTFIQCSICQIHMF